ncbi:phage major capsid protein [Ottowia sp. SB7-C50]|uniref:phage major capsid protein n=1 Tax=Ottowia sp. SB7-C50 TaxID=3081231 RepID=UPI002953953D|nr:phage major capsid protein [Ottowia sp. SB7-C50]WOP14514.1 phage major capsid protein [Ottowia sp. SB7-C50]WOP15933.1 phage major capsid protein [Ottowia sp. SB7-C50]
MKLNDLREARALKVTEMRAVLAKAQGENRPLSADETAAFDKLKGEIQGLEAQEQRAQFLEDAERRSLGQPADKPRADMEGAVNVTDAIRAQIEQRAVTGALAEFQQEAKRQGIEARHGGVLIPSSVFEKRATMTTTANAAIVPDDNRADQFIGLLRNSTIVRSLGARVLSGLRGDVVIPKAASASTAYWLNEGDPLTESNPGYASIRMEPKHVGALTAFSRQLALQSNPAIEQLLRDDIAAVIGLAVDKALIHGTAAAKQPVGILNVSGVQTASLATLDWAAVLAVFEKLALVNVTPNAILTHAKVATKLGATLKSTTAGAEYILQGGTVNGLAAHVTNQLDAKAGSPAKGRMIVGDFSEMVIGEWGATEVLANPYAAGYYEKGDVQLRILHTMDAVVRRPEAFVVVEDLAIA